MKPSYLDEIKTAGLSKGQNRSVVASASLQLGQILLQ
jgi:hypothetical protein